MNLFPGCVPAVFRDHETAYFLKQNDPAKRGIRPNFPVGNPQHRSRSLPIDLRSARNAPRPLHLDAVGAFLRAEMPDSPASPHTLNL